MIEYLKSWNNTALFKYIEIKFKGTVHPKMKMVINYSPSCRSKPVRPSFIFATQKIFLMTYESFLTLHRTRKVVRTSVK